MSDDGCVAARMHLEKSAIGVATGLCWMCKDKLRFKG